jgi:hypothetical protein
VGPVGGWGSGTDISEKGKLECEARHANFVLRSVDRGKTQCLLVAEQLRGDCSTRQYK